MTLRKIFADGDQPSIDQLYEFAREIVGQGTEASVGALTQLMQRNFDLQQESQTDVVTGLPNRTFLMPRLESALETVQYENQQQQRRGSGSSFTVIYMDLNWLKAVNDGLNPDAGDQLLVSFSEFVKAQIRPFDLLARVNSGGGAADEFLILAEGNVGEALKAKIKEGLEKLWFEYDGQMIPVRAGVGFVEIDADNVDRFPTTKSIMICAKAEMQEDKDAEKEAHGLTRESPLKDVLAAHPCFSGKNSSVLELSAPAEP